jgi:hypothetical protein
MSHLLCRIVVYDLEMGERTAVTIKLQFRKLNSISASAPLWCTTPSVTGVRTTTAGLDRFRSRRNRPIKA